MKKWIPDIICALMILLFTYAAISKLIDRQQFQAVLAQMLLIKPFAGFISFTLPVTELVVCALLFMPKTRLTGLYASFGLMILFTLYIVFMILFAPHLPCSCGGFLQKLNWSQHFVFNLVFIALSATAIKLYQSNKILLQHNSRPYSGYRVKAENL